MRFRASTLLLLSLCMASLTAPAQDASRQTLPKLDKPFAAPGFTLRDMDGKPHKLSDYRGKLVVLNFWATWCPPCRREMPSMDRLWRRVHDKNIVVLGINVGEDADTVFEFTGSYPVTFPLLLDQRGEVIGNYPVRGLPTTYIINPRGVATHRAVGSREWDAPRMVRRLLEMAR